MPQLAQVEQGFASVDAEPAYRVQALTYLSRWLNEPEFAGYRPQLEWLIESKDWAGLLDRFYQILPFGTGGRRGAVGIGPNRMNLWTLGASVQGHAEYLKERFPGQERLAVVLAYDVRQFEDQRKRYNPSLPNPVRHLSSRAFAEYAACVYVANGIHAHILPEKSQRYLATPELSFTIRKLGVQGGLNISASHNPPDDNGGKFYDERGGQPIAPDDQIMADLVEQVQTIKHVPWVDAVRGGKVHFLDDEAHRAYIDLCCRQALIARPRGDEVKVVFTPLHGVGSMTAMEVLIKQGFHVVAVAEQMKPDGQFPNVTQTPNPEVPASMDRAMALAAKEKADIVLSTDPDADRLGAMIPRDKERQDWQFVNGNSIAALITHFKLSRLAEQGQLPRAPVVVRTLVTTSLVSRIARHFEAQVVENLLVGFKYIAEVLWQLEQNGGYEEVRGTPADFSIGCEESHGVLVTPDIRDKDAAAGALILAELALDQKRLGRTVADYLHDIERQFGYFASEVRNMVMPGVEGKQNMARMLNQLRRSPPKDIGGLAVTAFDDLQDENGWMGPFKGSTDKAARNFLLFRLGDQARIALRPSGTEPKAKTYVEVCSPPRSPKATPAEWQKIRGDVDALAKRLADDFVTRATKS
ncbi:MAG: phospho-sugar mutase [Planctomycetes bacterium]|nr:phospho-sugar mutase [Planctomycetota bacterium]